MIKNKIIINFILFLIVSSNILNAMKISDIKGTEKLSNYNEIKNFDVERVVDYNNYERNKKENKVYVNGETIPFSGVAIKKISGKIRGLYFYENGISQRISYRYHDNGQLSLKVPQKNDKNEGKGEEYYESGKLRCNIEYKNGIDVVRECFYEDGSLMETYKNVKENSGILIGYYKGTNKKSFVMGDAILDYSTRGRIDYILNGKTLVYDKKGTLIADLNYKNNSIIGLQQKFYVNGKLKYDLIAASEDPKNFKAMDYAIEYHDNSDMIKLDCKEKESGKGNWTCKEYNKDGSFKREFDSPTYKFKQSGTKDWINYLLPILKVLTGW